MFAKLEAHPLVTIVGLIAGVAGLMYTFQVGPLKEEIANLKGKLESRSGEIKISKEYVELEKELTKANLEIKNLVEVKEKYNTLLEEVSQLKNKNETLTGENETLKKANVFFTEKGEKQLKDLNYKFYTASYDLQALSRGNNQEAIESARIVVKGLEEQIKTFMMSQCYRR